jgi:hypothetical protein
LTKQILMSLAFAFSLAGTTHAAGSSCDALVPEIEAKIRASGVTQFTLTTIDAADAPASGRIVGSCDLGTKRIVYEPAPSNAVPPAPPRPRGEPPILTECKDGTVTLGGDCRNQ